jgi:hypothetical protein
MFFLFYFQFILIVEENSKIDLSAKNFSFLSIKYGLKKMKKHTSHNNASVGESASKCLQTIMLANNNIDKLDTNLTGMIPFSVYESNIYSNKFNFSPHLHQFSIKEINENIFSKKSIFAESYIRFNLNILIKSSNDNNTNILKTNSLLLFIDELWLYKIIPIVCETTNEDISSSFLSPDIAFSGLKSIPDIQISVKNLVLLPLWLKKQSPKFSSSQIFDKDDLYYDPEESYEYIEVGKGVISFKW